MPLTGARGIARVRVERVVGLHHRRDTAGATTASLSSASSNARRTTPYSRGLDFGFDTISTLEKGM